jgi:serine/threonine protein kinase/Flp pilus assembly protein TadD
MTPERWQQIGRLYQEALGLDPDERTGFLARACGNDFDLRQEVESLLAAKNEAGDFLSAGAMKDAAKMLANEEPLTLVGKTLGHYQVLALMGSGGMGVVYKALDIKLHRQVALKLLPELQSHNPAALERFRREARTASSLNHPGICTIHEIGEHQEKLFIVMELLEGSTLAERIAGKPLPIAQVFSWANEIADALAVAHARGVIHRDIKPANVFLTRDDRVKILDFGLAKLQPQQSVAAAMGGFSTMTDLTAEGAPLGTVAYMSPEQARGEELDARTDLFSFGATLYEMATGKSAFRRKTLAETHDAILNCKPTPLAEVNRKLPDSLQQIIEKSLEKDRRLRYQSAAEICSELQRINRDRNAAAADSSRLTRTHAGSATRRRWIVASLFVAGILIAALVAYLYSRPPAIHALTNKDTIVLADFTNNTGETIFDGALGQALSVQFAQSPYLNILSHEKARYTLELMKLPASTRLTHDIAVQVCQRTNSTAMIGGSISKIGSRYELILDALSCSNGADMAEVQEEAEDRDHVLAALGSAATQIRTKLGELPASVKKYDVPMYEATTSSLEALRLFSLGHRAAETETDAQAIPLFRQATVLDPNFALAYYRLGIHYNNVGEEKLAVDSLSKSYALRDRVSELDNLRISTTYFLDVLGDVNRAIQMLDVWASTYPSDPAPHFVAGVVYGTLGQHMKAVEEERKATEMNPESNAALFNLGAAYFSIKRLEEAKAAWEQVSRRGDNNWIHLALYQLAFYQNDLEGMAAQLAWGKQRVGLEDLFLQLEAQTAAYSGHLEQARKLWSSARQAASRNGSADRARWPELDKALAEAEFGFSIDARQAAGHRLKTTGASNSRAVAALVMARAGATEASVRLADALAKENPSNTLLNYYWLPVIRASIAMQRGRAQDAVDLLEPALTYELAWPSYLYAALYPVYLRGQAYLALKKGDLAAAEFQKIVDHRNLVLTGIPGTLAHLYLGRARALEARSLQGAAAEDARTKARAAYQDFLNLWKDADPDIPILKQAKTEYAKLQ